MLLTYMQCDENRPQCGNCERQRIYCSLTESSAESLSPESQVVANISHNIGPVDVNRALPMAELELLHNSITSTNYTISDDEPGLKTDFLQHGTQYPYVLHSTLALSALHLFSKQPSRSELLLRASTHQQAALDLVRPHILDLTEKHSRAVLEFSAITSIISLAQPIYVLKGFERDRNLLDDLINSFQLSRGIKTIIMRQWDYFQTTDVRNQTRVASSHEELRATLGDKYPAMHALQGVITQHCACEEAGIFSEAVQSLFFSIAILEAYPQANSSPKRVQMWPIDVHKQFIKMLTARHPVALVILAHYAALMRLRSDTWWLCKWPRVILQEVAELLGPDWDVHLQWPRQRVFGQDELLESESRVAV